MFYILLKSTYHVYFYFHKEYHAKLPYHMSMRPYDTAETNMCFYDQPGFMYQYSNSPSNTVVTEPVRVTLSSV